MKGHLNPHYGPEERDPTGGLLGPKNDPFSAVWSLFAHAHDVPGFDPTGGYGRKKARPDLRNFGKAKDAGPGILKWVAESQRKYDPNRNDARRGGPHVDWVSLTPEPPESDSSVKNQVQNAPNYSQRVAAYSAAVAALNAALADLEKDAATMTWMTAAYGNASPQDVVDAIAVFAGFGKEVLQSGAADELAFAAWVLRAAHESVRHRMGYMPDPEGTGGGNPRSRGAGVYRSNDTGAVSYLPGPDEAGPGNPRSRRDALSVGYMPSPDDSGSGNPRSSLYRPDPETTGPGNPHS